MSDTEKGRPPSKILIPIPDRDFDTTEVSVPWRLLTRAGHQVVFATEKGAVAACDPLLLSGVLFGQLGAEPEPKAFYSEMIASEEFRHPLAWDSIRPEDYDGMIFPGGHAPGMRQYLGSEVLQKKAREFWELRRPVGAICHGVLVLARAGVLRDKMTTCLPKYMERIAYSLTAWKLGRYYRTYPLYTQDEVKLGLKNPGTQFIRGPVTLVSKGTATSDRGAFVVVDDKYVSARWPGDAYLFTRKFAAML